MWTNYPTSGCVTSMPSSYMNFNNMSNQMTINDWTKIIEREISSIKKAYNPKPIVKCKHCGQWAAALTQCIHCGASVDPE